MTRRLSGARDLLLLATTVLSVAACAQVQEAADAASRGFDEAVAKLENQLSAPEERYAEAQALAADGDQAAAVEIYRELAEGGHAPSAYAMGQAYETGAGVGRDMDRAADWYRRAVRLGSPEAQYLVGRINAEGAGVPKNPELAAQMFAKAAVQGHAPAQYRLGRAFANGEGVREDRLWAGRWYGKAARQGNADAQFAYGVLLASGKNYPRDLALGHALLSLANDQGVGLAQPVLDAIAPQMTETLRAQSRRHRAEIAAPEAPRFADKPTVRYVQAALGRLGYPAGPIDGLLGSKTRDAIRSFQVGLEGAADGELDPDFLQALVEAAAG